MTSLTLYDAHAPHSRLCEDSDFDTIAAAVALAGVTLERWQADADLPEQPTDAEILAAYAPQVKALQARGDYQAQDVVRMTPDHPARVELRQKFLSEHIHDDDEVRFFVEGSGLFCIHHAGQVLVLECTAGDLIVLPAGTRHWFDTGEHPNFTAIRLFTNPEGWIARYTGQDIAAHIP